MKDVPIPENLKRFPTWNGFVVHYTVWTNPDGTPDFKIMHEPRRQECFAKNYCHLCGKKMKPPYALIGGPLCVEHKRFVDGPMHPECALYAARVCPFLSSPTGRYTSKIEQLYEQRDGSIIRMDPKVLNVRPERMAFCLVDHYEVKRNPPKVDVRESGPHAVDPRAPLQLNVHVYSFLEVDWDVMPRSK